MKIILACTLFLFTNFSQANIDRSIKNLVSDIDIEIEEGSLYELSFSKKESLEIKLKNILRFMKGQESSQLFCTKSINNPQQYILHNGIREFGGASPFMSSCRESLRTKHRGLVCAKAKSGSGFQIYISNVARSVGREYSFKSSCSGSVKSMNRSGYFCGMGNNSMYQIFNSLNGRSIGDAYTFESSCRSALRHI